MSRPASSMMASTRRWSKGMAILVASREAMFMAFLPAGLRPGNWRSGGDLVGPECTSLGGEVQSLCDPAATKAVARMCGHVPRPCRKLPAGVHEKVGNAFPVPLSVCRPARDFLRAVAIFGPCRQYPDS